MKKSLISAIKKLLAKLGAEEVEGNNLVEVIDNGAEAIEGGSSSGGGVFIVNTTGFDSGATLDKTFNEIRSAMLSGKNIIIEFIKSSLLGDGYEECSYCSVNVVTDGIVSKTGNYHCDVNCVNSQSPSDTVTFSANSADGVLVSK